MGFDWMQHGWGWMLFGGIHMLFFWLLIILAIAALVKWLSGGGSKDTDPTRDALDVLNERYARGEIDRETYREMKDELQRK
ncbi:SHOCT domain-containing protein [Marinobacterium litorale]|jgi:putative membrane protein|uniref:SHOCT domain-containing protein n=1 Tax=Marinobacterium litorale TaxID=404770 RepID=UPI0003F6EF7F|nr:SHOCT domain-containing protein [Marinobacterium litorale]